MRFMRQDGHLVVAVLAAVLGTSLWEGSFLPYKYLSLFVPSILFIFLARVISNLYYISVEAKACAKIEERVQSIYGEWLMDWESKMARKNLRGIKAPNALVICGLYLLFIGIFIYFSIEAVFHFGLWTIIVHGVECIIIFSAFILSLRFDSNVDKNA